MKFSSAIIKPASNKVTVALSMGCDSLAIAHFLKVKYPKMEVKAFHYNHNLREQNNVMAEKAKKFCRDFNIELVYKKRDPVCAKTSESDLRKLRYGSMENLGYVITGHHLDDCCENYLYNCFNGTPEYLPIPVCTPYPEKGFTVIRPFILNEKKVFEKYVKDNGLEQYLVEDETNTDTSYRRNWLRHAIIPQIKDKGYNITTIVKKRYLKSIQVK